MKISSISVSPCLGNSPLSSFSVAFRQLLCLPTGIGRTDRLVLWLGLLVLGTPVHLSPAQAQLEEEPPVQAQDLYRMQEVRDVVLSPHGRFVAYTVRRTVSDPLQADRSAPAYRTQLYVAPATGTRTPKLLIREGHGLRQPAWHPDGTYLAFVRDVRGTPQVFVVSLNRGAPYQLTTLPSGAQHPQWSPDGERLLFASAVPESAMERRADRPAPSERPGRTPQDRVRTVPPDTILVLRHAQTLDPADTLAFGPEGLRDPLAPTPDTTRTLRTPEHPRVSDSLAAEPVDSLLALTPDSLRAVFDSLRLRPDTTTVPVAPDTAATPNGDLVQVRRWLNQNRQDGTALVSSRLELQGERRLRPSPTYRHHFVVDVPSDLRSQTPPRPEARPVTRGYRSYGQAEWLPGSGQIVVSGMPPTSRHPDRVQRRNLYVVDLNRDRTRRLLRIENHALTAPNVTADGTTVAFRAHALSSTSEGQAELGLFALDGRSKPRVLTSEFDRAVASPHWSPDGWYLYATAAAGGGRALYRFTPFGPDTARADAQERSPTMTADRPTSRDDFVLDSTMVRPAAHEQMTADARTVHTFDVTDATAVYSTTDPGTPSALYTNTVSFNNEKRFAAPNADWLSQRRLAAPERMTAVSPDSLDVTGRVTRPASSSDSRRHPLLVQVRGGPAELSVPHSPETWFERQYLTGRGMGLLEVLPRGSPGFGTAFRRANDRNWGPGPAQDVLALVDSATALPWTDSTQVALGGASYGASVATWLLGQTDRFEAAVSLNGIYDLAALVDEGQAWRLVPREFGGYPWESPPPLRADTSVLSVGLLPTNRPQDTPRADLHRNSPITYADQIDTPLLLLQGARDRRGGPSQGERMYKRLKILDRPVEYVRYPGVGHDLSATATPAQRVDRLVRTYEFLARFLDLSPAARPSAEPNSTQP